MSSPCFHLRGQRNVLSSLSVHVSSQAPEGESQPMTEVDLFISTQRIKVLNADTQVLAGSPLSRGSSSAAWPRRDRTPVHRAAVPRRWLLYTLEGCVCNASLGWGALHREPWDCFHKDKRKKETVNIV